MCPKSLFYHIFVFLFVCCQVRYLQCQTTEEPYPVIKKCFCEGDEIQSVSGCQNRTKLQVNIWDKKTKKSIYLDLTTLNSTIIQPLTCPEKMTKDIYREELPFISTEGKLLIHPDPETDLYCLEYIINDLGNVFPYVERCLEKMPLRLCCKTDEYLDSSERCTKIPGEDKKKLVLQWFQEFNYTTNRTICEKNDIVHNMIPHIQQSPLPDLRNHLLSIAQDTRNNFCLGMYGDENEMYLGVSFCNSALEERKQPSPPTIPHCCQRNHAFDLKNLKCVPHTKIFVFPMESIEWPSQGIKETVSPPNCSAAGILTFNESGIYSFAPNGSLLTKKGQITPFFSYCLGTIITNNVTSHSGLICLIDEEPIPCRWRLNINLAGLIISSFFLVATLVVYLGIPELRRRIGGVCLISELLALLISQITLMVLQLNQRNFSPSGCLAAGVIEIIFFLASFFWLNIMCYDVWSTFRVLRPYSEKVLRRKLFIKYSIYGWGIPLLVGIVVVVVEKLDLRLRPNFSPDSRCFFADHDLALHWLYLYGWILLLLLVNLGLFVHLAFTLLSNYVEQKKQFKLSGGSMKSSRKTSSSQDMENLKLHGKLFIIMGVPWLIEVFTSLATEETLCYIWFLDVLNVLRGVLIFVIFVCKKSARDLIINNWFPWYKSNQVSPDPSRKTSTMSLSSWFSSIHGRKISKVSMTSAGHLPLGSLREETHPIEEENERKIEDAIQEEREKEMEEGQIQETKT